MKQIIPAIKVFLILTVLTGVIYPLLMTVFGQLVFPTQANGSLIVRDGKTVGSKLIAQKFASDKYFWERPSAVDYNPLGSGGSNLGPTSEALRKAVSDRKDAIRKSSGLAPDSELPQELIFASASGLDPELSPEATEFQIDRVAKARGFDQEQAARLRQLVAQATLRPDLTLFGEPRVNILELNLTLDALAPK